MKSYPSGKLPINDLMQYIGIAPVNHERLIVGPGMGLDAAALDYGDRCLLVASDPVTFTTSEAGRYAVQVNANDIAVMGGRPLWFSAILLFPLDEAVPDEVKQIFTDMAEACRELGVVLCGGHTEITHSVNIPVISGTMLGEVKKDSLVTAGGAKPGDAVIMTKGAGIEGTAILARDFRKRLEGSVNDDILERASDFLKKPGIDVVKDASLVMNVIMPSAMHDATEGGFSTALRELASASEVGLNIYLDQVIIPEETRILCETLEVDPMGLISSGSLIVTCSPEDVEKVLTALIKEGIKASKIGEVRPLEEGLILINKRGETTLPTFERDELARLYENVQQG